MLLSAVGIDIGDDRSAAGAISIFCSLSLSVSLAFRLTQPLVLAGNVEGVAVKVRTSDIYLGEGFLLQQYMTLTTIFQVRYILYPVTLRNSNLSPSDGKL